LVDITSSSPKLDYGAKLSLNSRRPAAESQAMPTHREKPEGFEEAARRRTEEVDAASERARRERALTWRERLALQEEERRATSVPPPPRS
jgi:hypothetical protein